MKILKYFILGLFILNLPGIALSTLSPTLGSILSYSSFLLLFSYYIFFLRGKPNFWLFYIGIGYFFISGFQIYSNINDGTFLILIAKYTILVLFGNSFFKTVTRKELNIFLLIGAASLILNVLLFADDYGRYSGFYLNPNAAGFVCITGYSLAYTFGNKKFRTICQIFFTIAGLLTFSRTFMLLWLIVNLLSLRINIKNGRILVIGLGIGILILTFGELFNLGGLRFKQFQALLNNESSAKELEEGSRTETWALFYDEAMNHPFFGGGFGKFQTNGYHKVGPHNTYLLIVGESGIIPLFLFVALMLYLLIWSNKLFKLDPSLLLMSVVLSIYLLTSHNYFDTYFKLSITLYIYQKIEILKPSYSAKDRS